MVSVRTQRLVTLALALGAVAAMALAIAYQGPRDLDEAQIPGLDVPATGGGGGPAIPTSSTLPVNPIEELLPRSGEASACREAVGVDLQGGYGATLNINGIDIAETEMNVNIGADGEPSDEVTASRSLGQYTYGPEETCPNGAVLRPTDNVMRVCVYRIAEGPKSCTITEVRFDVL